MAAVHAKRITPSLTMISMLSHGQHFADSRFCYAHGSEPVYASKV
jgi:hypothetical protein